MRDGGRGASGRRATFTFAALAHAHAKAGDLEAAVTATDDAVTAAGRIHSHRALQTLAQARADLTPHQLHPSVSATLDRMRLRLPQLQHLVPAF